MPDREQRDEFAWGVVAIAALALFVRALYLLSIRHAIFFDHLLTEPARYDAWAWDIVRGVAPVRPPFDEAPGYPYLVALVYSLGGRSHLAVAGLQALIDAASCAAVAVVGRRVAGARAGLFAGLLLAVYAPAIYFAGQIEPATLAVAAVSVCLLATPWGPASDRRLIGYGAIFALGLLVRSELLLALPLVLLQAALVGGRRAVVRVAALPALFLAASLAINYASSRHLVLTTTGAGANLWIGNGPNADGVSPFVRQDDPVVRQVERYADDAVVADEMFRDHALRWMMEHPAHAAALALKKLAWTFSNRELPNASDIEWETAHSWLFRRPGFLLSWGLLLPLASVGLVALERRRRALAALLAPVGVAIVVGLVFFTNARFRMTMIPALAILAGVGVDRLVGLARARPEERGRWRASLVALLIGLALAWLPFGGVRAYRIAEIDVNTASLELADGRLAEAVPRLRGALATRPDDVQAWMALGTTLERLGRLGDANQAWADAERALPLEPAIASQARAFRLAHPNTALENDKP